MANQVGDIVDVQEAVTPDEVIAKLEGKTDETAETQEESTTTDAGQPESEEGAEGTEKETEKTEEAEEGLNFGGTEITIEDLDIPEDLSSQLSEKGFDAADLAKELYTGEFGLGEETIAKLNEAYGSIVVNSVLNGINAQNQLVAYEGKAQAESAEKAAGEAWTETLAIVGDEAGWDSLMEWSGENLSEDEIQSVNNIMENGDWNSQKLVIEALYAKSQIQSGSGAIEQGVTLTDTDNSGNGNTDNGAISFADYREMHASGEYSKLSPKEQLAVDARRRLGQNKGI